MKIIVTKHITESDSYELKMVKRNTFSLIVPMEVTLIDDIRQYAYDIGNAESVAERFKTAKISKSEIVNFISCLKTTIKELNEYLVSIDKIMLDIENIYCKEDTYLFCFCNENDSDFQYGLEKVLEFFLEKVDYDEKDSVLTIYELYHKVVRDHIPIECIELSEYKKETPKQSIVQDEIVNAYDYTVEKKEDNQKGIRAWLKKIFSSNLKKNSGDDYTEYETVLLSESDIGRFLVYDERGEEKKVSISRLPFIIGSDKEHVDLYIKIRLVSRLHARIFCEGKNYFIEDQKSTNGTKVNDRKLKAHEVVNIVPGDLITVADVDMIFK